MADLNIARRDQASRWLLQQASALNHYADKERARLRSMRSRHGRGTALKTPEWFDAVGGAASAYAWAGRVLQTLPLETPDYVPTGAPWGAHRVDALEGKPKYVARLWIDFAVTPEADEALRLAYERAFKMTLVVG